MNSKDLMLIHTNGLSEGIRCALCKNPNHNDRGCDGACMVNQKEYDEIMKVIDSFTEPYEKQIAKKVIQEDYMPTTCSCGHEFSEHHGDGYYSIPYEEMTNYCPDCGQKLKWK